jgi:BirA family transcriptional regulator, biotin operon repressor / biotin---[acetyl-CoA-carboxylase] ligase
MTFAQIESKLMKETFVRQVIFEPVMDSTNTYAIRKVLEDSSIRLPCFVTCDRQTAGRGRGNHTWWSSEGSVISTLAIERPISNLMHTDSERFPSLALALGLAVRLTLQEWLPNHSLKVKWPNDVYVDDRKISGILIEGVPGRSVWVIGCGINVNNSLAAAPDEVRSCATSIVDLLGNPVDREAVLVRMYQHWEKALNQWSQSREYVNDQWEDACWLTGKPIRLQLQESEFKGVCLGVNENGALRILTNEGEKTFVSGSERPSV